MRISSNVLLELMFVFAKQAYGKGLFKRRSLMNLTERKIRDLGLWEDADNKPSESRGAKSKGLAQIDWRFSDLASLGRFIAEDRKFWKISDLDSKVNNT